MKPTTFLLVIILLMVSMTTGCKAGDTKLTAADNGKTVEVKTGDLVVVELEGNPSTGFNWEAKNLDTNLLEQVGEPEFKSANPGLIGSSGTITLTFKTLKAGTASLDLIYHRSWETDVAPEATFSVSLAIK